MKEGVEGFAVLREGNDTKTIFDLLVIAGFLWLRVFKEGFKDRGYEGEEQLEDAKVNVVG